MGEEGDEANEGRMPTLLWEMDWKAVKRTIPGWVKTLVGEGR